MNTLVTLQSDELRQLLITTELDDIRESARCIHFNKETNHIVTTTSVVLTLFKTDLSKLKETINFNVLSFHQMLKFSSTKTISLLEAEGKYFITNQETSLNLPLVVPDATFPTYQLILPGKLPEHYYPEATVGRIAQFLAARKTAFKLLNTRLKIALLEIDTGFVSFNNRSRSTVYQHLHSIKSDCPDHFTTLLKDYNKFYSHDGTKLSFRVSFNTEGDCKAIEETFSNGTYPYPFTIKEKHLQQAIFFQPKKIYLPSTGNAIGFVKPNWLLLNAVCRKSD